MNFLVLLLVVLYATRAETQDFVCDFRPPPRDEGAAKGLRMVLGMFRSRLKTRSIAVGPFTLWSYSGSSKISLLLST